MVKDECSLESILRVVFTEGVRKGVQSYNTANAIDTNAEVNRLLEDLYPNGLPSPEAIIGVDGYRDLANVLNLAFEQAAFGKGNDRHAEDKPFEDQPIMTIQGQVGHGYTRGQAIKKLMEAKVLLETVGGKAAREELLGAIVYTAAAYLYMEDEN